MMPSDPHISTYLDNLCLLDQAQPVKLVSKQDNVAKTRSSRLPMEDNPTGGPKILLACLIKQETVLRRPA